MRKLGTEVPGSFRKKPASSQGRYPFRLLLGRCDFGDSVNGFAIDFAPTHLYIRLKLTCARAHQGACHETF